MTDSTILDRVSAAFASFSDADLNDGIEALGEGEHLVSLAQALNIKRPALLAHPAPCELVRPRVYIGPPGRRVLAALSVAGPCSDDCIDVLGDAADEPTRDDMNDVLDGLVERWGTHMVTLMLTAYPAMDAPCGPVFIEILDSDARFEIPDASFEAVAAGIESLGGVHNAGPAIDERGLERARKERDARIAQEAKRRKKRKK